MNRKDIYQISQHHLNMVKSQTQTMIQYVDVSTEIKQLF